VNSTELSIHETKYLFSQLVKVIIHIGLEMATVMMRQTLKDAILMVETVVDQTLIRNIVLYVHA
jgi:hypothetical protein